MLNRLRFLNPLTRDAAYRALLDSNAQVLHSAVAEILAGRHYPGGANEDQLLVEIAHHCAAAGEFERAHHHCAQALYAACRSGSIERAIRLAAQAAELWQAARAADPALPSQSLQFLFARADLLAVQGNYGEAQGVLEELLARARAAGNKEYISRGLTSLASLQQNRGELDEAERNIRGAEALAVMLEDPTLERFAVGVMGGILLRKGERHAACECMVRALEIARAQGNISRTAAELSNLASVETALGELDKAEAHYRESLELARWLGNAHLTSLASGNLGDMLHEQGRSAEARVLLHEALGIAREIGRKMLQGYWLNALGYLEVDTQHPVQALGHLSEAREIFAALGDRVQLASVLAGLAQAELALPADSAGPERLARCAALLTEGRRLADAAGIAADSFTRRMLERAAQLLAALSAALAQ